MQHDRRNWLHEPFAYDQAVKAANRIFEAARPEPGAAQKRPPGRNDESWELATNFLLLAIAKDKRGDMFEGEGEIAGSLLGPEVVKRIKEWLRQEEAR
jgi:hypothetical protein